jgi:hypothetical protein
MRVSDVRHVVAVAWTLGLVLAGPHGTAAQTLMGRVLDQSREAPVSGARVALLDRHGEERTEVLTDAQGRFVIAPPDPGDYYLEATRIGYHRARSPLLALRDTIAATVDLMMQPAPIGLEGFEVEVDAVSQAENQLKLSGIEPRDLGPRFIDRDEIDAVAIKPDVGRVLEWSGIGSLRVIRPENLTSGSDDLGLCVSLVRARLGSGASRCAMIVWNGVRINQIAALDIDPETIGAMAVLLPTEAVILYGKRGEAGALVLWSRTGRPR